MLPRRLTAALSTALVLALLLLGAVPAGAADGSGQVRFATFNASLNRSVEGELIADLSTPGDVQAQTVAQIIQRARPDVLLVNEFDYDPGGRAVELFDSNYLEVSLGGAEPFSYPYRVALPY